jgi:hypothetical protein
MAIMSSTTEEALIAYVIALMHADGFTALHVDDVIPRAAMPGAPTAWTQFVQIDEDGLLTLSAHGVSYDRLSGWFRKITPVA